MKYLIPALLITALTLAVACVDDDDDHAPTATASATSAATVTSAPTATSAAPTVTAQPTVTTQNVCQANPAPGTSAQTVVTQPVAGDSVTSPMTVTGHIAAFEAQFNIHIKDASGTDIAAQPGHSAEGQTLAPFSETVPFAVMTSTPACLWVFDFSEGTGLPIQVVQVPVTLEP